MRDKIGGTSFEDGEDFLVGASLHETLALFQTSEQAEHIFGVIAAFDFDFEICSEQLGIMARSAE